MEEREPLIALKIRKNTNNIEASSSTARTQINRPIAKKRSCAFKCCCGCFISLVVLCVTLVVCASVYVHWLSNKCYPQLGTVNFYPDLNSPLVAAATYNNSKVTWHGIKDQYGGILELYGVVIQDKDNTNATILQFNTTTYLQSMRTSKGDYFLFNWASSSLVTLTYISNDASVNTNTPLVQLTCGNQTRSNTSSANSTCQTEFWNPLFGNYTNVTLPAPALLSSTYINQFVANKSNITFQVRDSAGNALPNTVSWVQVPPGWDPQLLFGDVDLCTFFDYLQNRSSGPWMHFLETFIFQLATKSFGHILLPVKSGISSYIFLMPQPSQDTDNSMVSASSAYATRIMCQQLRPLINTPSICNAIPQPQNTTVNVTLSCMDMLRSVSTLCGAADLVWRSFTQKNAPRTTYINALVPVDFVPKEINVTTAGTQEVYSSSMSTQVTVPSVFYKCQALVEAGDDKPSTKTTNMGVSSAKVSFYYQTFTVKDRIDILYEGKTIFTTGCVGASSTVNLGYSGKSNQLTVNVTPNCAGTSSTQWEYSLSCPTQVGCRDGTYCPQNYKCLDYCNLPSFSPSACVPQNSPLACYPPNPECQPDGTPMQCSCCPSATASCPSYRGFCYPTCYCDKTPSVTNFCPVTLPSSCSPLPCVPKCVIAPGLSKSECGWYTEPTQLTWLPDHYAYAAMCACRGYAGPEWESPTAQCVRKYLRTHHESFDTTLKIKLMTSKEGNCGKDCTDDYYDFLVSTFVPVIYQMHVDAYASCCCPGTPAPQWTWGSLVRHYHPEMCPGIPALIMTVGPCNCQGW